MSIVLSARPVVVLGRTDSIGDMVLTLPMAGVLKAHNPAILVVVIGQEYTRAVVACSPNVDQFYSKEEVTSGKVDLAGLHAEVFIHVFPDRELARLAKAARIPYRIGTSHRWWHWLTCNERVSFTRRGSNRHEAQLNLRLLEPLGINPWLSLEQLLPHVRLVPQVKEVKLPEAFERDNFIILHPKSKNSAREWPLANFYALAKLLTKRGYIVAISGTKAEGELIWQEMPQFFELPGVVELLGRYPLDQFIKVIEMSRGLIACSTGPLHLAAALGEPCVGIYPPIEPMDPTRWAPLGPYAEFVVENKSCDDCRKGGACACVMAITPAQVLAQIEAWPEPGLVPPV